jgi:hypothetical protein
MKIDMLKVLNNITDTLKVHPGISPLESSCIGDAAFLHLNFDGQGFDIAISRNQYYDGEYKDCPPQRKTFYLSLARELVGYCVKVFAESEAAVRLFAEDYYKRLWCQVYDHLPEGMQVMGFPVTAEAYDRVVKDAIKREST